MAYNVPGVHVEEISTLPPSVAPVSTAVPAFIGYTQKAADKDGVALDGTPPTPKKINTLLEYEQFFGGPHPAEFKITVTEEINQETKAKIITVAVGEDANADKYLLYYALKMYFDNGGGSCYVVSAGKYDSDEENPLDNIKEALNALALVDEPTLLVIPDVNTLKTPDADPGYTDYYKICEQVLNQCNELQDRFAIFDIPNEQDHAKAVKNFRDGIGIEYLKYGAAYTPWLKTTTPYHYEESSITVNEDQKLEDIKVSKTDWYNQIKRDLAGKRVTLPPSAAMAGVYARTDRDRGVWKAPANVSVNSVIEPVVLITSEEQAALNIHPEGGKSINAIRSFAGRGTLVWGARTLAGNDNEWRYINVRRLFLFIEESLQKATQFAVFESNNTTTWLKIKAMTQSFLFNLWQQGALAGPDPESAYFVNVGLGKTMTPDDILNGIMKVDVGIAAVRPAEFIVLRFSHKLQEA